jgi:ABC-2 type transport system ATP-binding protein
MIELTRLTKNYGDFTAVDRISLTARPGEVFGFLGPNGAGKTTTIRILAGLSLPTSGEARVGGFDVVADPEKAKAITGYVPDRPFLYEKLTGIETLRFVCDLYGRPWSDCRERADGLLRYFDIDDWSGARVENFSHGMKQKLVLVSALVHDPQVLIIDEPMVGLDAHAQRQVRLLLRSEAARGKTVFLTTHTLTVAEAVCDSIAILSRGAIVATGSVDEVRRSAGGEGSALEEVFLQLTYPDEESR